MSLSARVEGFSLSTQRDTLYDVLPCTIGSVENWLDSVQTDLALNDTLQTCETDTFRIVTFDLSDEELLINNCQTKQFNR